MTPAIISLENIFEFDLNAPNKDSSFIFFIDENISTDINDNTIVPKIPTIPIMILLFKKGPKPDNNMIRNTASSTACPAIIFGPTQKPFFAASLMVTVKSGPGTIAPENATKNEVKNIVIKEVISNSYAINFSKL